MNLSRLTTAAAPPLVLIALLLSGGTIVSCSSPEERAQEKQAKILEALQGGERRLALKEIESFESNTPEELILKARLLIQAGEAPRVIWMLQEGLQRFPDRQDLRIALAQVALFVDDTRLSMQILQEIPSDSDYHLQALVMLAQAEMILGHRDRAYTLLEQAREVYPDRVEGRIAQILFLTQEKRFEDARLLLEEAATSLHAVEDETLRRQFELALYEVQIGQGEVEEAIDGLKQMIEFKPDSPMVWRAFINALASQKREDEAEALLNTTLEQNPEFLGLYPLLSHLQLMRGDQEAAENTLVQLSETSTSTTNYLVLIEFYRSAGNRDRMHEVFREAIGMFPEDPDLHRFLADDLIQTGRLEEAEFELELFRRNARDQREVRYLEAELKMGKGDAAGARDILLELVSVLDTAHTQYLLGRALEELGDTEGAKRRYGLAARRQPDDPIPLLALLRIAYGRGDWRTISGISQRIIMLSPESIDAWDGLISSYIKLGEFSRAEKLARILVERFPENVDAKIALARVLRSQRRFKEALTSLEEAEATQGETPKIIGERALTTALMGNPSEGIEILEKGIEKFPEEARLYHVNAAILFQVNRREEGYQAVDRALALDPADPNPLLTRTRYRLSIGDLSGAEEDCTDYIALRPDDSNAYYILGTVYMLAQQTQNAIDAFRRSSELDELAFKPLNNLATLLMEQGEIEDAVQAAQRAYAMASDNPYVIDTLGWIYLQKGLTERSIALLEKAVAAEPRLPKAELHLALAHLQAGNTEKARTLLTTLQAQEGIDAAIQEQAEDALNEL